MYKGVYNMTGHVVAATFRWVCRTSLCFRAHDIACKELFLLRSAAIRASNDSMPRFKTEVHHVLALGQSREPQACLKFLLPSCLKGDTRECFC